MTGVSLLFTLAAICGVVAAGFWFQVALSVDATGEGAARSNKRALGNAATSTAIAFALASAGVLIPTII